MKALIKVGTLSLAEYYIKDKKKLPIVGEKVFIKQRKHDKWEEVLIYKYNEKYNILFAER